MTDIARFLSLIIKQFSPYNCDAGNGRGLTVTFPDVAALVTLPSEVEKFAPMKNLPVPEPVNPVLGAKNTACIGIVVVALAASEINGELGPRFSVPKAAGTLPPGTPL